MLVYSIYKSNKDFRFKEQIQSAAVSIMNNIAEGFERQSNKEFIRFLFIARGSCGEVRSMNYLSFKLNYVSHEQFCELNAKCVEISKMLHGFIHSLKK